MNINDFAREVTRREGKKRELSIAQVKETIKVINELLFGQLYVMIRKHESK